MTAPKTIMLEVDGKTIAISPESAEGLAQHLWRGLEQGAVTAAARLERVTALGGGHVEFPPYETYAVQDALVTLGLPDLSRIDP